jgi:chromosome segregation ATPase
MGSRALETKTRESVGKVERFVAEELAPPLAGLDLSRPIEGTADHELSRQLREGVMSGGSVARIRLFAPDGTLLYSTDESDRIGSTKTGDIDLVRAASGGAAVSVAATDRVVAEGESQSLQLLQVYVPLSPGGPAGTAVGVDLRYKPIAAAGSEPWTTVQLGAAVAAVVCVLLTMFELTKAITAKRLAARSGFTGADANRAAARAATKEAKVRQALEASLEEARSRLRDREQENAEAEERFASQVQELSRKLEEARRRTPVPDDEGPGSSEELTRLREELERRVVEVSAELQAAEARIEQADARADAAEARLSTAASDLSTEAATVRAELDAERERARSAQARVAEAEQRAQGLEQHASSLAHALEGERVKREDAARSASEVRTRVEDAEERARAATARAEELEGLLASAEARAQEAHVPDPEAIPDAAHDRIVELERLVAEHAEELDATRTRLRRAYAEAESAQAQLDAGTRGLRPTDDGGANDEIQRLRVELGQAMERAAAAEIRASRLQADLAETRATANGVAVGPPDDDVEPPREPDEASEDILEEDRSLRFRLARNAARKKGLSDEQMWS